MAPVGQPGACRNGGAQALIVTRPRGDSGEDAREKALHAAGVVLQPFPLIRILPPLASSPARQALARLADFDLAVPVSPSAVQATMHMLREPWPQRCAVGLVGPGSRATFEQALRARGQEPEALRIVSAPAEAADSEGLWTALHALRPGGWSGAQVLILRGGNGRDWLAETLERAGAVVQRVDVYRRAPPDPDQATLSALRDLLDMRAVWLLTSSEGVHNLLGVLDAAGLQARATLAGQRAIATHARIAQAAREAGFGRVDVCAPEAGAIVAALGCGPEA